MQEFEGYRGTRDLDAVQNGVANLEYEGLTIRNGAPSSNRSRETYTKERKKDGKPLSEETKRKLRQITEYLLEHGEESTQKIKQMFGLPGYTFKMQLTYNFPYIYESDDGNRIGVPDNVRIRYEKAK